MTRSPASSRRSSFVFASRASCALRKANISGGLSRFLLFAPTIAATEPLLRRPPEPRLGAFHVAHPSARARGDHRLHEGKYPVFSFALRAQPAVTARSSGPS